MKKRNVDAVHVSMVSYGLPHQTTARLFAALDEGLARRGHLVNRVTYPLPRGLTRKIAANVAAQVQTFRQVRRSDVLMIHTPLAISVLSVIVARLLRKSVVAFVWDIYPESTVHSDRSKGRPAMALYWLLERTVFALSTSLVIPSKDYLLPIARWRSKIREVPLWPCDPIYEASSASVAEGDRVERVRLKVAFAGQINGIRSLGSGAQVLLDAWAGTIELHLFSDDDPPPPLLKLAEENHRLEIVYHGSLAPELLQNRLSLLDVGWVSLDPAFKMPAFPSKSLAYLASGLPIWFSGPELPNFRHWLTANQLGESIDELVQPFDAAQFNLFRTRFAEHRDSYLGSMEPRWFGLEALL